MFEFSAILTEVVESVKSDVINSLQANNRSATGDTIKAIESKTNTGNAQLLAPDYLDILETGRGGAKKSTPKFDIDRLKRWCVARGIDEGAAWAIKNKINKEGFEGTRGVLTIPLSDANINTTLNIKLEKLSAIVSSEILESLKI